MAFMVNSFHSKRGPRRLPSNQAELLSARMDDCADVRSVRIHAHVGRVEGERRSAEYDRSILGRPPLAQRPQETHLGVDPATAVSTIALRSTLSTALAIRLARDRPGITSRMRVKVVVAACLTPVSRRVALSTYGQRKSSAHVSCGMRSVTGGGPGRFMRSAPIADEPDHRRPTPTYPTTLLA